MRRREGDPEWADQLGSFDRDVVMKHAIRIPDLAARIEEMSVPCAPFGQLLSDHGITRLDLLHIDTEGYDFEILKTVDFAGPTAPGAVLYEHAHLSPGDVAAAELLLRAAGYRVVPMARDTYAERRRR